MLPLLCDVTLGPLGLQLFFFTKNKLQLEFTNTYDHRKWSNSKSFNKIYFCTIKVVCESNISEVKISFYMHSCPPSACLLE